MSGPDPSDLGDRIAKAQAKREERAKRDERQRKNSVNTPASMALRYSSELVAAVVVGVGLGLLIDHFAKSSPWGLLVMMGFGMAAGIRNLMRAAKQLTEEAQKAADTPEPTDEKT
ncbi:MAG: F0F1 ATP synthase assembly protein I [Hyphomonas sp.]|uniref:AtpZ/AtpI family protein n=1 Tax=Hyphomonas sp. TaxID=87 RepID=UPI0017B8BBF6|nr:AtpZ/AtpI family protein [Hyphomonas sp.]MBU3920412.1 AtpZ/AtpI family protein [Alphaproteobacteria bacterium]MBA3069801.1 F0F1 ATP synthase assembly protein I [Hyphomonas sp.]MBU4062642.1 AtpZ/AtpI family protein [Alphaproteobacteria bacterium]MBU4163993.1 AtpZ/AtpI family protein [Alphaproteobacteria bacterium]MBU4567722.1 AtpZ/AtpI family protein [Alphaproteobacteria bacterium]